MSGHKYKHTTNASHSGRVIIKEMGVEERLKKESLFQVIGLNSAKEELPLPKNVALLDVFEKIIADVCNKGIKQEKEELCLASYLYVIGRHPSYNRAIANQIQGIRTEFYQKKMAVKPCDLAYNEHPWNFDFKRYPNATYLFSDYYDEVLYMKECPPDEALADQAACCEWEELIEKYPDNLQVVTLKDLNGFQSGVKSQTLKHALRAIMSDVDYYDFEQGNTVSLTSPIEVVLSTFFENEAPHLTLTPEQIVAFNQLTAELTSNLYQLIKEHLDVNILQDTEYLQFTSQTGNTTITIHLATFTQFITSEKNTPCDWSQLYHAINYLDGQKIAVNWDEAQLSLMGFTIQQKNCIKTLQPEEIIFLGNNDDSLNQPFLHVGFRVSQDAPAVSKFFSGIQVAEVHDNSAKIVYGRSHGANENA